MLEQIATVLSILVGLKKIWDQVKKHVASEKQADNIGSVIASRFIRLFKKHGVDRNQIPRFFGHGLPINFDAVSG